MSTSDRIPAILRANILKIMDYVKLLRSHFVPPEWARTQSAQECDESLLLLRSCLFRALQSELLPSPSVLPR